MSNQLIFKIKCEWKQIMRIYFLINIENMLNLYTRFALSSISLWFTASMFLSNRSE